MKYTVTLLILILLTLAGLQYPAWQKSLQQLAIAEQRTDEVIARGTNSLDFSDLTEMRRLPSNIADVTNLKYLTIRDTNLTDLSGLERSTTLTNLDVNHTRVTDLTPLAGLPELKLLYLHNTWITDLSPLAALPSLERLDVGKTQIETLQPVTQLNSLRWLNLYSSHALDGSQAHFRILEAQPLLDVSGGNSYRANYRPGWQYIATVRLSRLREQLGI